MDRSVVSLVAAVLGGLILSWYAPSICNSQQPSADPFAQAQLNAIIADFQQEILNGSTSLPSLNPNNYPLVYLPVTGSNMVPMRNGVPATWGAPWFTGNTTLIRVSTTGTIPSPGVNQAASCAFSTGTSANGRSIVLTQWNQHYLVPLKNVATPTDTTPVSNFPTPAWIYTTASGQPANPPLTAPNSSVIGRYAFAVYDESALMDVNAAGYPQDPSTSGTMPAQYAPKGALAFADLTQFSGMASVTQTGVNNLVGWRNYASLQPAGIFPNLTFTGTAVLNAYENIVTTNTNGFLAPANSTPFNGQSDQLFSSRQQLINLVLAIGTTNFNPNALQYLGTFSRAINAPSWYPSADASNIANPPGTINQTGTDAGGLYAYKTNAELPIVNSTYNNPNRDLLTVRFLTSGTSIHYGDNGIPLAYLVNAGDPLIQRRFSLARLAWPTYEGPSADLLPGDPLYNAAGTDANIQACFGLQWNNAAWRWEYVGASGSATQTGIETLDQVAGEPAPREPNFFELLKAGILAGSLGRDPGHGIDESDTGVYSHFDNGTSNYKAEPDIHILQIGANIIDQASPDNYPSAIHMDAWDFHSTPIDDLALQTVYGSKNLPCLLGLCTISIADPAPAFNGDESGFLKFWLQPQLWNPYQVPVINGTNRPIQFRAHAYGSLNGMWFALNHPLYNLAPATGYDLGNGIENAGETLGEIYFSDTDDGTSPFYNNPCFLAIDLATTSGALVVDQVNTPSSNYYDSSYMSNLYADGGHPNKFAGFALFGVPRYDPSPTTDTVEHYILPDPFAYFSLQYQGPDGNYHPYNFMARTVESLIEGGKYFHSGDEVNAQGVYPATTVVGHTAITGWGPSRPDPRTDRFSEANQWWEKTGAIAVTMNPRPNIYYPVFGSGAGGTGEFGVPVSSAFVYLPALPDGANPVYWMMNNPGYSATANAYYYDQDGVVRYADCYRMNQTTGDGCQLFTGTASVTPSSTLTAPNTSSGGSAEARRPVILSRPLRSIGELGFAFRDLPYKSVDFWSPLSGDAALLDLFSATDQPAIVAGQINPNSAPAPVLQAIFAGAAKSDALDVQMSATDAQTLASMMAADISGTNGPYINRANLATRLGPLVSGTGGTVAFNTSSPTYANWANKAFAEAPVRALADVTNTRTWNLMIDLIAQTGTFSSNAPATIAALNSSFNVQGETHYWLHVAIDRYTGKVVDQSLEQIPDGPILNPATLPENQPVGVTVGALNATGMTPPLTYALVSGSGSTDNASFTISGNMLQTAAVLQYLTQSSYNVRVRVTDQNGVALEQPYAVTLQPSPYTQWKITNFQANAGNPAIAGDTANPAGDRIPNLLKYAMGLNPLAFATTGITTKQSNGALIMTYTLEDSATDVTTQAWWSSDLVNWSTTGVTQTMLDDNGTIQLWQATAPSGSPRIFLRLQVSGQ